MKDYYPHIGLAKLCGWFGITRQAYYQNSWKAVDITVEEELIIKTVKKIREDHGRMGTRKLYEKLKPFMKEHYIKMGRDSLFTLLSANKLLIRSRKRRVQTTQSFHWLRKYPNLIRGYTPTAPNRLWVSDITYWKIKDRYVYISFVTDAYSRRIVGYHLAESLEAVESAKALKMALSSINKELQHRLIHHSDRGIQYCSGEYVKLLQNYNIQISMTENGDPLENAIAERVNGIIKDEYLYDYPSISSVKEARELLAEVIDLYNDDRPHLSIGNCTPNEIHFANENIKPSKLWKNYYQKKESPVNLFQD